MTSKGIPRPPPARAKAANVSGATGKPRGSREIAGAVLSDVGSVIKAPSSGGGNYDDNRSMPLRGNSLGKLGAPDCYACVLVQGLPICRRRQRNGQRLLPHRDVHRDRPNQRLSKCRGQWQPNAPTILSVVRDAALQRGRGAPSSDLRPRRHLRRSESRRSCDDDLDIVCAALGLHGHRVAASSQATTTSGVTNGA